MKEMPGIIAVLCKKSLGGWRFAVFQRKLGWEGWELIKGSLEDKESYEEAAKREVEEESGIREFLRVVDLNFESSWEYENNGEKILKRMHVFLIEVPENARINTKKSVEHSAGHFLNFRDAYRILEFGNMKEALKRAKEFLEK